MFYVVEVLYHYLSFFVLNQCVCDFYSKISIFYYNCSILVFSSFMAFIVA